MSLESLPRLATPASLGVNEYNYARALLETSIIRVERVGLYRFTHVWPDETYPVHECATDFIAAERSSPGFDSWLRHYMGELLLERGYDLEEGPNGETQVARVRRQLVRPEPAPPYNWRVLSDTQREELTRLVRWLSVCGDAYVVINLEQYHADRFEYKLSEWPTHTLRLRTGTVAAPSGFAGQEDFCDEVVQTMLGQAPGVQDLHQ